MLINIQFLRFAAAFLVVLYHGNTHVLATGVAQGPLFTLGETVGFAGVDIFFVISGFIMFYTTEGKRGGYESGVFFRRRLARIFSGYWPFLALAAIVFWWARPSQFAQADMISSIFLLPVPMNRLLLDVSWTLTYEMYFYVLFTILLLFSTRLRFLLIAVATSVFLVFCLLRQFVWQDFSQENLHSHSFANMFYLSPYLLQFFAGAVLARFSKGGSKFWGGLLLVAGIAGFAAAGLANINLYDGNLEQGYYYVSRVLFFGIPASMMLLGLIWLENSGVVAPRKFSILAGGASYAIYLSHTLFQAITMKLGFNQALSGSSSATVEIVFLLHSAVIVVLSIAWFVWAERPLNQLFKKILLIPSSRKP